MRRLVVGFAGVLLACGACKRDPNTCYDHSITAGEAMWTAALTGCGDGKTRGVTCTPKDDGTNFCTCSLDGATQKTFSVKGGMPTDAFGGSDVIAQCGF